jgi:dCMP deaminase
MSPEWQETFRDIALAASKKSKDTSTKVGAVLVRPDMTVASLGFNGFPKRMLDNDIYITDPSFRTEKLKRTVHAEQNCLRFSRDNTTEGYHLVVTRHPCEMCALEICCTGISNVWYLPHADFETRWADSLEEARSLLMECGIRIHRLPIIE